MQLSRITGAAVFAIGVLFLAFAYKASNAPLEQIADTLSGHYSDQTTWYLILGVGCAIGGGLLLALGIRR